MEDKFFFLIYLGNLGTYEWLVSFLGKEEGSKWLS